MPYRPVRPHLRLAAAMVTVALATAGCTSDDDPPGPSKPATPSASPSSPTPTQSPTGTPGGAGDPALEPPVALVSLHAGQLAADLVKLRESRGGFPLSLQADKEGRIADTGVVLSKQERIASYKLIEAQGAGPASPAEVRVCLQHEQGPWAAFDSSTGQTATGLDGKCAFGTGPGGANPSAGTPRSFDELLGSLVGDASRLGQEWSKDAPTEKEAAAATLLTPEATVSAFEELPSGKGVVFCVSGKLGGWVRFDSRDELVSANLYGRCSLDPGASAGPTGPPGEEMPSPPPPPPASNE